MPEAPASCNVYVLIGGHRVQVTLRDTDEHRMLERLQVLLTQYPADQPQPPAPATRQAGEGHCAQHGVQMKWYPAREGKAATWLHKTAEGKWCRGR